MSHTTWPLCLSLQLETAATAGVVLVLALIALLGKKAWDAGFPAIQTGDLPLWSLKVDGHLPEAFAVVGYAFYMQVGRRGVHMHSFMQQPEDGEAQKRVVNACSNLLGEVHASPAHYKTSGGKAHTPSTWHTLRHTSIYAPSQHMCGQAERLCSSLHLLCLGLV